MKLIIDIPEWKYKSICEGIEASKRCGVVGIDPDIHEAIYNGIPYEERLQGEWIVDEDNEFFANSKKCSNCGEVAEWLDGGSQFLSNFCPKCGAKMGN